MDQTGAEPNVLAFVAAFYMGIVIFGLAWLAFNIYLFWRVFEKAGFSGALALINLFPGIGTLVCMLILAFSEWPSQRVATYAPASSAIYPSPPPPPPPPQSPPSPPPPNPSSELPA